MHGNQDNIVPIEMQKYLSKQWPHAQLEIIEGAEHLGEVLTSLKQVIEPIKMVKRNK